MAALRWPEDAYLLVLGTIAFGFATIGFTARKVRWRGWKSFHILGMSISYVTLLTAFYVDNGPRLPLVDHLPAIAFWTLPSLSAWCWWSEPFVTTRSSRAMWALHLRR